MEDKKIRVAITHGDTNGIGYELIFKTFVEPDMFDLCVPIIYGSPKVAAYHRKVLNVQANFSIISNANDAHPNRLNLLTTFEDEVKVDIGTPTDESGEAASRALERAVKDLREGLVDALVTAPVSKGCIKGYQGQTDYIEKNMGEGHKALSIMVEDSLRVGLLTNNIPLKDVAKEVTADNVREKIKIFNESLKRDFRVSNPRIAVLSLNPNGKGEEEQNILAPIVAELMNEGINVFGPFATDKFYGAGMYNVFDGILAMYHDQGLAPFRALVSNEGLRFTAGLPIVRTSPDHGPMFEIAGKGEGKENSLRHAIYSAIDTVRNREAYDEPLINPLKKLYHEKKDESEKVRFAIPKKHEGFIPKAQGGFQPRENMQPKSQDAAADIAKENEEQA